MSAPMITPSMIRDWTKGLDTALTGYTEAIMSGDAEGVARFSIQIEARVRDAIEAAFRAAFALATEPSGAARRPEGGGMSQSEMDRHFNSRRALKKRIEELAREVTHLRRVEQAAREAIREHNCGDIEACYVCGPLERALAPRSERREGECGDECPHCGKDEVIITARYLNGSQMEKCRACGEEWLHGFGKAPPAAPKEER